MRSRPHRRPQRAALRLIPDLSETIRTLTSVGDLGRLDEDVAPAGAAAGGSGLCGNGEVWAKGRQDCGGQPERTQAVWARSPMGSRDTVMTSVVIVALAWLGDIEAGSDVDELALIDPAFLGRLTVMRVVVVP